MQTTSPADEIRIRRAGVVGRLGLFAAVVVGAAIGCGKPHGEAKPPPRPGVGAVGAASPRVVEAVPFTPPPAEPEWRLGLCDGRGGYLLEAPAGKGAREEEEALTGEVVGRSPPEHTPPFGLVFLPFSRVRSVAKHTFVNPRTWTVFTLAGRRAEVSFPRLATLYDLAGIAGGYYLASASLEPGPWPVTALPDPQGLAEPFVGYSSPPAVPPTFRSPGHWRHRDKFSQGGLPAEWVRLFDSPEVRRAYGEEHRAHRTGLVEGFEQPFTAVLEPNAAPSELRLVGWGASIEGSESNHGWCVARQKGSSRAPLAVYFGRPWSYGTNFRPRILSAADLDGDGSDELLVRAGYYEGESTKVLKVEDGRFVELYDSYYVGE